MWGLCLNPSKTRLRHNTHSGTSSYSSREPTRPCVVSVVASFSRVSDNLLTIRRVGGRFTVSWNDNLLFQRDDAGGWGSQSLCVDRRECPVLSPAVWGLLLQYRHFSNMIRTVAYTTATRTRISLWQRTYTNIKIACTPSLPLRTLLLAWLCCI